MTVNQEYVGWLVDRIKNEKINPKTGLAFTINDIKITEYKDVVITEFKAEVASGTITTDKYKTYTGLDYVA